MIYGFLQDPSFINSTSAIRPAFQSGGICVSSKRAESFFVDAAVFEDPRDERIVGVQVAFEKKYGLLLDLNQYADFSTSFQTKWSDEQRAAFYNILDYMSFVHTRTLTPSEIEYALANDERFSIVYKPASYAFSTTFSDATVYLSASQEEINCPDFISFAILFQIGEDEIDFSFKIWLNNAGFLDSYPISTIIAVVPPMPLADLYSRPLTDTSSNMFSVAKTSSSLELGILDDPIIAEDQSGYMAHSVKVVDTSDNYIYMPFNILYKGHAPGVLAIREAIRNQLLSSGIGDRAGWKARIPELFVAAQFYMIPLWDNTYKSASMTYNRSAFGFAGSKIIAAEIMFDQLESWLDSYLASVSVSYNAMSTLAIPNTDNENSRFVWTAEHPTYQHFSSTDASFAYMADVTKRFSIAYNKALAVAAGAAVNEEFSQVIMDNRVFLAFTVDDVEYYVITMESYLNIRANS